MIYRDRQGLSPTYDSTQTSNNRDRYLDNCFLLCVNRDDDTDIPEIHRLETNVIRELYNKSPSNQIKSQQLSKHYVQGQRVQIEDNNVYDNNDSINLKQENDRDCSQRRKGTQYDADYRTITNHSKYQHEMRNDYNIMQHSDDELSVYEVYVPNNTLSRLSNKRTDNNLFVIDYEDASRLRDINEPMSPYGHSPRPLPTPYNEYNTKYPYDASASFVKDHNYQQAFYPNNPQQRLNGYYQNEGNRQTPTMKDFQSVPFVPTNIPIDYSNAINVRRHVYSPSQLPQGLTEGQLVMLLQKGSQYQQMKTLTPEQQIQQPSTISAVTVSHQTVPPTSIINSHVESIKTPEYIQPATQQAQIKISSVPPEIIGHRLSGNDKNSMVDEITKPMSTLNTTNTMKLSKDTEPKENIEKKKDKTTDSKKDKKSEKDISSTIGKKDGKKEKSSGKDSKKKKK